MTTEKFPKDIADSMRSCMMAIFWPKEQILDFFNNNSCTKRDLLCLNNYVENKFNRAQMIDTVFKSLHSREDGGWGQFRSMLASLIKWEHFDPYYFKTLKKLDQEEAIRQINHLKQVQEIRDSKAKDERKQRESARNIIQDGPSLNELNDNYINLYQDKMLTPQQRGYKLEKILQNLVAYEKLKMAEPFKIQGEQIDGSIKYDGENYIVEAKWHDSLIASDALYHFAHKVEGKMYGRGFFISINGFSTESVNMLVTGKSIKTILIDGGDLSFVFGGNISLNDLLDAKVRAAQTKGIIYFDAISEKNKLKS